MSGAAVELVGVAINVKFDDFRSNRSPDIWLPHFVMEDERRWLMNPVVIGQNALLCQKIYKNQPSWLSTSSELEGLFQRRKI